MEEAGQRGDYDVVFDRRHGGGRGHDERGRRPRRNEQQEVDDDRQQYRRQDQQHPDEYNDRYYVHRSHRGPPRPESPPRRRSRTPRSRERYIRHRHHGDDERRGGHGAERRAAGRKSSSPWSRSSDHGRRSRNSTSRSKRPHRRRRSQSRSRSRSAALQRHRRRRDSSMPHQGRRDSHEYCDRNEQYYHHPYHPYPDRESERQSSRRRRRTSRQRRRRSESTSSDHADERSYSPSPPPPGPPRARPPNHQDAPPRAGVVSDDEEHHHQQHPVAATTATKPAPATAVARLRDSPPPKDEDDNNDDNNLRSPSFHDDSIGHFRGGRGTLIADRYRIIRDVGFGTFGRVVECLDLESRRRSSQHDQRHRRSLSSSSTEKYVAIKIVRKVKRYNESAQIEARIVQDHVNRRGGRGVTHCAILHDAFTFSGHFCMVFENLGLSLYDFMKRNKYQPFPMACIQDFTVQLLQTLEFLHSFRLIHTDLKIENILLVTDRETTYGNSRVPESTHIKVIDFGGACFDDAKKSAVINTRQYRAPEVMLGTGWSMPSDIWSLGCILAELYQGELLFPTHNNNEHLALMEHVIGPFPFSLIQTAKSGAVASELAREAFDSNGRHVMERILSAESVSFVKKSSRLESIIRKPHDDWFLQLLRRMLVFDPEARATAHECLRYLSTIRRDVVRHA